MVPGRANLALLYHSLTRHFHMHVLMIFKKKVSSVHSMILCRSCSLPFKVDAVQCCDEHDPVAKVIGCSTQSLNAYVSVYGLGP
jgi:shikimate 5-dehydrogenase